MVIECVYCCGLFFNGKSDPKKEQDRNFSFNFETDSKPINKHNDDENDTTKELTDSEIGSQNAKNQVSQQ